MKPLEPTTSPLDPTPPGVRRQPQGRAVLTQAVTRAIQKDASLCLEAPDAPDWTPHLLAPIVEDAVRGAGQVIIAIASRARRDQLLTELNRHPFDRWSFSVGVFRPTQDFLCPERLELLRGIYARLQAQPLETPGSDAPPVEARARRRRSSPLARRLADQPLLAFPTQGNLEALFHSTDDPGMASMGLLELLPASVGEKARAWASVDSEDCIGTVCPLWDRCPAQRDRTLARASTVVLTDYAGLLELAQPLPNGERAVDHRVVVLIEAHAAVDDVRQALTWELALELLRSIQIYLTICGAHGDNQRLWRAARAFFSKLTEYRASERYQRRLTESQAVDASEFLHCLELAGEILDSASGPEAFLPRLKHTATQARQFAERLESALSLSDHARAVWLDLDDSGQAVVVSEPIRGWLEREGLQSARSVIAHSELLSARRGFGPLRGASPELASSESLVVRPLRKEQPRLLLIVPEATPDSAERAWPSAVASRFLEVLRLGDVPTLGCFSSSAVVAQLQEHARRLLLRLPQPVRRFGDWVELAHEPATISREGLEPPVQPTAFPCVVVDRLPFVVTHRAWLDAIRESDPTWFDREVLPRAVAAFRRAVGYALRSEARRVAVVVFDRRLLTRSYGSAFLEGLPSYTLSRHLEDLGNYLLGKEIRR